MWDELQFALTLTVSGLSIGLMYSLIALGFVLVYKATEAINFAQGEFVMLAGFVGAVALAVNGMPVVAAVVAAVAVMVAFSFALERVVLRPLLGRPIIAVIMATIGLGAMLRGLPPITVGGETRALSLNIGDLPIGFGPISLPPVQILGVVVTLAFLALFTWFFMKSRMGVAMRAVADNQQVAMAMGINVERYFALAWAMAGIVSALGGVIWGSMLGVDVHLALVGLKVFPVVILGRARFRRRCRHRRTHRRRGGESGRRLPRSLRGRRHQGLRALRADDRRPDVQALRHLRHAQG